jgi:hypothetical protein
VPIFFLAYHPVAALIGLVGHQLREDGNSRVKLLALDVGRQLIHLLNRVRLEEILVVQMVKQNVESLLSVGNVLPVLCGSLALDSLKLCIENLIDRSRSIGDV